MVRAKFVAYLPVGYPTLNGSIDGFKALIDAGADVLELGVPYSDPVMDGSVIQEATQLAIKNGFHIADVFRASSEARAYATQKQAQAVEIYVMSYYNMILHYGLERFATDAIKAGVDGTIIPDLIPDEASEVREIFAKAGLKMVFLVAPNSTDERIGVVAQASTGFIYVSSTLGVTGVREDADHLTTAQAIVRRVRGSKGASEASTYAPVYLGIGVSTPAQAREIATFADGVIVGSRLVKALMVSKEELYSVAHSIVEGIAEARARPTRSG